MILCCFNSIKVRLKPQQPYSYSPPTTFQFHKGPIKAGLAMMSSVELYSFNSIKVRLKPAYGSADASHAAAFQFHKGSIKAQKFIQSARLYSQFQFHKGPIKTLGYESIDPRLLLFHVLKGPIKARARSYLRVP